MIVERSIERLQFLCDTIPGLLHEIDEQNFSTKPAPGKWSKKEIIGHLIDSATNNHHRFVRGQFENIPTVTYEQNNWNESNYYDKIDSSQIISLWTAYNKHLLEIMKHIPKDKLTNKVNSFGDDIYTIEYLMDDYVRHLEHHLKQVVDY